MGEGIESRFEVLIVGIGILIGIFEGIGVGDGVGDGLGLGEGVGVEILIVTVGFGFEGVFGKIPDVANRIIRIALPAKKNT